MITFDKLFYAAYDSLKSIGVDGISVTDYLEMGREQAAFLSGLIEKYKPQHILEVGTSSGASAALIQETVNKNGTGKVTTVDLAENWYKDNRKKTGWLLDELGFSMVKRIRGGIVAEYIEKLAKEDEIDFLFLDAAHFCPGELLDFLCILPFLKKDAIVVLHDIALGHFGKQIETTANMILFASIVGDRYLYYDEEMHDIWNGYPNIGAFRITDDTQKYIENVFCALIVKWNYMPTVKQLDKIRNILTKYYSNDCIELFDKAVVMNKYSYREQNIFAKLFRKIYYFLLK